MHWFTFLPFYKGNGFDIIIFQQKKGPFLGPAL